MAVDTIEAIMENAINIANQKQSLVDLWCNAAWNSFTPEDAPEIDSPAEGISEDMFPSTVTLPPMSSNDNIANIVRDLNSGMFVESAVVLQDKLAELLSEYMTTYFPSFTAANEQADIAKLRDITDNKGHLFSAAYEQQFIAKTRDIHTAGQVARERQIRSETASRGYPVPPGLMHAMLEQARLESEGVIAQNITETRIKLEELAVQSYLAAVDKLAQYRLQAANAAVDYISTCVNTLMKQSGADSYAAILGARNQMLSATTGYYQAIARASEVKAQVQLGHNSLVTEQWKAKTGMMADVIKQQSSVSVGAANAMAQVAASALSSINSVASLSSISST